ncbi:hypothetical protein GCM10009623_09660 [Nocardioides aestuarii]|uniref:Uncharacterized protein n=1 Tax=Nocardioides aestuarii TaxID=252231 RepID=A0ABW4TKT9_9ACTN
MTRARTRLAAATAAIAVAATGAVLTASPAEAAKPDTSCMKAGIKTLQSAGLLDDVARDGLAIETAVSLGVGVRDGADISGVPDPLPLSLILADHRAGSSSLFTYPWCPGR